MADTNNNESRKEQRAEETIDHAEEELEHAEEELERAKEELGGEQHAREDETITISKTNLWQGIAGLFAALFILSIALQGVGVSLGTNQGSAGAPSQGTQGGSGSGGSPSGSGGSGGTSAAPASVGDDPVLGQEDAPVTLVKFTDFGCPFCQRWHDNTKPQIESNYVESGQVKIVYKDAPIPQLHPGAPQAHAAANCVYQNSDASAYYEYTDALYSSQDSFAGSSGGSSDFLVSAASDLGVDIESCLQNNDFQDEIDEDKSEAEEAGLRGTPHFVVKQSDSDTGTPLRGAQPYSRFETAIEDQLN